MYPYLDPDDLVGLLCWVIGLWALAVELSRLV